MVHHQFCILWCTFWIVWRTVSGVCPLSTRKWIAELSLWAAPLLHIIYLNKKIFASVQFLEVYNEKLLHLDEISELGSHVRNMFIAVKPLVILWCLFQHNTRCNTYCTDLFKQLWTIHNYMTSMLEVVQFNMRGFLMKCATLLQQHVMVRRLPRGTLCRYLFYRVRDWIWIYSQISIYSTQVSYLQHWKIINTPLTPIVKKLTA